MAENIHDMVDTLRDAYLAADTAYDRGQGENPVYYA